MAINKFIRNSAYFRNLSDNSASISEGHTIDAEDFDEQFKLLADYINNTLIEAANDLNEVALGGIDTPGSIGMLFRNVGDGTTEWAFINGQTNILDGEISLEKLKNAAPGTILTTYQDGEFVANKSPPGDKLVFQITENNLGELEPVWALINGEDFENRSISGNKIALETITSDNLRAGTLIVTLADNSVTTPKFSDGSVTTPKLRAGDFNINHFSQDLQLPRTQSIIQSIRSYNIKNGAIPPTKFLDESIPFMNQNFVLGTLLGGNKLADNSIGEEHLFRITSSGINTDINTTAQTGRIISRMLAPGFRLQSEHIPIGEIVNKEYFTPDVQAALAQFGL